MNKTDEILALLELNFWRDKAKDNQEECEIYSPSWRKSKPGRGVRRQEGKRFCFNLRYSVSICIQRR